MKTLRYIFFLLLSVSAFAQDVEFVSDSDTLRGTLISTASKEKVVLIIAGSGPTDRNGNSAMGLENNSLKMLAEGLAENGISALRYDKRGVARSQIKNFSEADLSFDDLVADAKNWINWLEKEGYNRVIVAGHSQGSLVGMLAAQDNERVSGFVSIAGAGKDLGSTLVAQITAQSAELGAQSKILMDSIVAGHSPEQINPFLASLFRPSIFGFLQSYGKYNPSEEIRKLTIPVMVINGTTDIQVGVAHAQSLTSDTDFDLKIYEGMNHVLKEAPLDRNKNIATYSQPDLPLFSGLIDDITKFINSL